MKRLGIIIGVLLVTIISPFVVQFGWNEIVTTILSVGKISFWQALGVDALLTFINPTIYNDEEISKKTYSGHFKDYIFCICSLAS